MLGDPFERLGLEPSPGEHDLRRKLRSAILMGLGRLTGDPAVIEACRDTFDRMGAVPIDPDVAYASTFVAAAHGDEATFEEMVRRYEKADTPQDKNRLLFALAEFPGSELASRSVAMTLDGTIRSQDGPYFVSRLLYNRRLRPPAWNLITESWDRMIATYPPVSFYHVLDYLYALSEPDKAHAVETFLEGRSFPQSDQALPRRLEELRIHRALRKRESERLSRYLAER